jgi:hypothetical protein
MAYFLRLLVAAVSLNRVAPGLFHPRAPQLAKMRVSYLSGGKFNRWRAKLPASLTAGRVTSASPYAAMALSIISSASYKFFT